MRHCNKVKAQPRQGQPTRQAGRRSGPDKSKVADVVSEAQQVLGLLGPRCDHGGRCLSGGRRSLDRSRLETKAMEVGRSSMRTLRASGRWKGFVTKKKTESQVSMLSEWGKMTQTAVERRWGWENWRAPPSEASLCCCFLKQPVCGVMISKENSIPGWQRLSIPKLHEMWGNDNAATREGHKGSEASGGQVSVKSGGEQSSSGEGDGNSSTGHSGNWKVGKGGLCARAEEERPLWRWSCCGGEMAVGLDQQKQKWQI